MVENLSSSASTVFGRMLYAELNGWDGESVRGLGAAVSLAECLDAFNEVFGNGAVKITRLNPAGAMS